MRVYIILLYTFLSFSAVRCQGLPGNSSNGKVLTNKTSSDFFDFGETVEYRCNFGYVLETDNLSSTVLMCESSTHFSATAPTCAGEFCCVVGFPNVSHTHGC